MSLGRPHAAHRPGARPQPTDEVDRHLDEQRLRPAPVIEGAVIAVVGRGLGCDRVRLLAGVAVDGLEFPHERANGAQHVHVRLRRRVGVEQGGELVGERIDLVCGAAHG